MTTPSTVEKTLHDLTERRIDLFGLDALKMNVVMRGDFIASQKIKVSKPIKNGGLIIAELRFDDECKNGHESFSITGTLYDTARRGDSGIATCGCIHDEITKHSPKLAHLIKWHLVSTDGPMHYVGNTIYHASNLDYNGRAKGEVSRYSHGIRFNDVPLAHTISETFAQFLKERQGTGDFQILEFPHTDPKSDYKYSPHYTFAGFNESWAGAPFKNRMDAENFRVAMRDCKAEFVQTPEAWSEGKVRELDYARNSAVWPEADDATLMLPKDELTKVLLDRLPALQAEFKAEMLACGFLWPQRLETV